MKTTLITLLLLLGFNAGAQNKYSVSGTITDSLTGEQLIGTAVIVEEIKGVGTVCNEYGFYSLTLPQGNYTFSYSMLGYRTVRKRITLSGDHKINIRMSYVANELSEVEITGSNNDREITGAQMGTEKLNVQEINKIPVLMGEKDILKTIQLLPGIKSAGEANTGFHVRGGGADQNLILLDEAPVYNASHLMGLFSTFNSDVIKDVTVYKGTMPAQYGGRLSSVLDVKMNEGDRQRFHAGGGIGLISSRVYLEGPIVKEKGSFIISGRRTYADMFLKLHPDEKMRSRQLYFYDLNAKSNYILGEKDRIYFSGYFGRDQLALGDVLSVDWGNVTGTLRWNHIYSEKLFSNTSLISSDYNYQIGQDFNNGQVNVTSEIRDWNLKHEFQYYPDPSHTLRFGLNSIHHTVKPGQITASENAGIRPLKIQDRFAWENALYISDNWKINEKLNMIAGLRAASFSLLGRGDFFRFDNAGNITDVVQAGSNEILKTYFHLEPRLSLSYALDEHMALKGSYNRTAQNLHMISNSTSASPTDIWLPSSLNIKPETANQYALGFSKIFAGSKYELISEAYYKDMYNQVDYKNGANTQANEKIEGELLYGKGRAYGVEVLVKKKSGRLTGWLGYTLSRTERKIDGINSGNWYAAKQDRTHDISIVGMYDLSKKWSLSAAWVYNTGNAVTFPTGKYTVDGQVVFLYSERNAHRMPAYHRLDLGATWEQKKTEKFESSWNFSVYNAYGRENAYIISFREDPNDPSRTQAIQTTLFKIVPSVTYQFRF